MNLHAVVGDAHRDFAGIELGHRRLERGPRTLLLLIGRAVSEQPRGFDPRCRVGEFPLDGLKGADGPPEGLALAGVAQGRLVSALREPDRQRRNPDAAGVEHLHRVHEALTFFPDQLVNGDTAIVEQHFAGIAGTHAQLVFFLPRRHSGCTALDDEGGDAFRAERAVGDGHHHHHVAHAAMGGERLRTVDAPALAGPRRGGPHAGGIAPRGRLGQPPGANLLAARQRRQILLLLLLAAEGEDVRGAEPVVRGYGKRDAGIHARQLLDADTVIDGRHGRAAVGLGKLDAQQPERGQLRHQLDWKVLLLIPLTDVRADFGFRELTHRAAQQLLLFCRTEIHRG